MPLSGDTSVEPEPFTSNPASIRQTVGGVGFNVARAASLAGAQVEFCSVVGKDLAGNRALDEVLESGLSRDTIYSLDANEFQTAQYVSMNDTNKSLTLAMADMQILEQSKMDFQKAWEPRLLNLIGGETGPSKFKWLIVDANWSSKDLHRWCRSAREKGVAIAFEPVSVPKSTRLLETAAFEMREETRLIDLATPSQLELLQMHEFARTNGLMEKQGWWEVIDSLGITSAGARSELVSVTSQSMVDAGIPQRAIQLLPFFPNLMTKLGPDGILITRILPKDDPLLASRSPYVVSRSKIEEGSIGGLYMRLMPPEQVLSNEEVISVNGAGDTFLGVLVARLATKADSNIDDAVAVAQRASALTLRSAESVSPEIQHI